MRMQGSITRFGAGGLGLLAVGALAVHSIVGLGTAPAVGAKAARPDPLALGREIFHREWLPGDGRGHGGDGLGPVYNDTSCIACHNSGGSGGGGPNSKNIDILSASTNQAILSGLVVANGQPQAKAAQARAQAQAQAALEPLVGTHAGFRTGRTVVLHRFGTDPNYDTWRRTLLQQPQVQGRIGFSINTTAIRTEPAPFGIDLPVLPPPATESQPVTVAPPVAAPQPLPLPGGVITEVASQFASFEDAPDMTTRGQQRLQEARAAVLSAGAGAQPKQIGIGGFVVSRSQRNPTSLFGLGLIDRIPAKAIEEAASRRNDRFPEVQGRVSRLKDGKIGRLGWKGQTASVEDFVLTACAVELGLEVPGHHQAIIPQAPKYQASGLDLTAEECAALVAYVGSLPRPMERRPAAPDEHRAMSEGKALFASIGCASCHAPSLGGVDGIYSDLLLHDMGQDLGDTGSYNGGSDDETLNPILSTAGTQPIAQPTAAADRPASRQEWRTPPLWGFRDSGPYLHDGRAETLDQAVSMHGGQGMASARRYFELSPKERRQVEMFLKSLVAPADEREDARGG